MRCGGLERDNVAEQCAGDTVAARWARAVLVDWVEVFGVFLELEIYGPSERQGDAETGCAGGENAVGLWSW